jgi:hypothetical protein
MTTGNTTLLGLALPVEGELDGTWGDVVNDSITSLVDSAVAGTTTLSVDADVTLTTTVLAANQARQAILRWTASNGATTRNITAPAQSKPYIVINAGTGSIVLRGAGPTTGITIIAGERCLAAWSGADFVKIATSTADGVTSVGGTGTVNGITLTGTVTSSGDLTLGGTLSGVSLATQVTGTLPVGNGGTGATTSTGSGAVVLAVSPALTGTATVNSLEIGFRGIPSDGAAKTSSYTLATTDAGEFVEIGSGGSITVPTSTFAAGDAVVIFNNNAGTSTITTSAPTVYVGGTNTTRTSVTLAARGICNVLFITPTLAIITGNVT